MDLYIKYFSGQKLYGDDFNLEEIKEWYIAEEEGYAEIVKEKKRKSKANYSYEYNSMNSTFGFQYLSIAKSYSNVLGFGSAFGYEFLPIIDKIENLTIVEPSEYLISKNIGHLKPKYVKPQLSGSLAFPNDSFDLITCFSALHHVPNVEFVLRELIRVLKPGGILMIREPIRTMGDWRLEREGLTKNERGIPHQYFDRLFNDAKVKIVKKTFCDSNFAFKILSKIFSIKRDTMFYQRIDKVISYLFSRNIHYHAIKPLQKVAPASVFYVLQK